MKLLLILCQICCLFPHFAWAAPKKYALIWEMAHERDSEEYRQQLDRFSERLRKRSEGQLELTVRRSGFDGHQAMYEATNRVYRGEVQSSQVRVGDLVYFSPEIGVMTVPFLFENHAHAARAMDGAVGKELLRGVSRDSREKIKAFAFTYSGGFRQISGIKKIHQVEDLKGFRMLQPGQKTALEYFDAMGATFTGTESFTPERGIVDALAEGKIDGTETEYARAPRLDYARGKIKYVNETNHALYLTVIVGNGAFLRSLPTRLRSIIEEEIHSLAAEERAFSIENEKVWKNKLIQSGIEIIVPSNSARKSFITATEPLYKHYERTSFGRFLSKIQRLRRSDGIRLSRRAD